MTRQKNSASSSSRGLRHRRRQIGMQQLNLGDRLQRLLEILLARRSHSRCEVCEAAGVPLQAFEVPPVYGDPDIDRCAFECHARHPRNCEDVDAQHQR